jgi:hypothetical protein
MRAQAERAIRAEHFAERMDLDVWAEQVVSDLLRKNPPEQVWRGTEAGWTWFDEVYSKMVGLDVLGRKLRMQGRP